MAMEVAARPPALRCQRPPTVARCPNRRISKALPACISDVATPAQTPQQRTKSAATVLNKGGEGGREEGTPREGCVQRGQVQAMPNRRASPQPGTDMPRYSPAEIEKVADYAAAQKAEAPERR